MLPQARRLAEAMRGAGRPLTMAECAALLKTKKASAWPEKIVAWYFARVFRPAASWPSPATAGSIRVVSDACAVALVPQPDPLKILKSLVLDTVSSPLAKRRYEIALDRFIAWAAGRAFGSPRAKRLPSRRQDRRHHEH